MEIEKNKFIADGVNPLVRINAQAGSSIDIRNNRFVDCELNITAEDTADARMSIYRNVFEQTATASIRICISILEGGGFSISNINI